MIGRGALPSGSRVEARHVIRPLALVAGIAVLSGLRGVTDPSRVVLHEIYNDLCYLPIILGVYWYGVWGGVLAAAVASVALIAQSGGAWSDRSVRTANLFVQIAVFQLLGLTVGLLAGSQRKLAASYRDAAASLERVNRELRDSQEHLRRADRLSALGDIKGALEIIASRVPLGTPEAEFAEIGGKELARLQGLVGEFLTYARPNSPALRQTDVHELIERVAALVRSEANQKQVKLIVEHPSPLVLLALDSEQMTQVLFNVVLNAVQATKPGGDVRIVESAEPGWAVIDVADDGPGIPPEHASRIFDPFFTTKSRGTGLGLATAQRIVLAHRGTIAALPRSPSGSVFRIRLPLG
jgi:two-component system, NtrC family, sensor histidine kinase HydH